LFSADVCVGTHAGTTSNKVPEVAFLNSAVHL
jgi:hypothetical protein